MIIILDSNIIIAALIKDSLTRKLITDLYPDVYYPEVMTKEIKKYKNLIKEKAKLSDEQFYNLYKKLFKYIKLISDKDLLNYKEKAMRLMKNIDVEDHPLLAASFCFPETEVCTEVCIWSNDPHLKKQTKIKTYTTNEIIKSIKIFLGE